MLSLPKPVKERIAKEFRFAADGMAKAEDLLTKLYFFTVFFGETNRAFNLSWHRELALLNSVLSEAYRLIQSRAMEMQAGIDRGIIGIPKELPQALTTVGEDLASLFEKDEIDEAKLFGILARIAELGYVTTGNGHYLLVRGHIKL